MLATRSSGYWRLSNMSEYNPNFERIRWTAENTLRLCDENLRLKAENQRLREQIHREGWNDLLQERDFLRQQVEELQERDSLCQQVEELRREPKVEKAVWQHAEVEAVVAERDSLRAENQQLREQQKQVHVPVLALWTEEELRNGMNELGSLRQQVEELQRFKEPRDLFWKIEAERDRLQAELNQRVAHSDKVEPQLYGSIGKLGAERDSLRQQVEELEGMLKSVTTHCVKAEKQVERVRALPDAWDKAFREGILGDRRKILKDGKARDEVARDCAEELREALEGVGE